MKKYSYDKLEELLSCKAPLLMLDKVLVDEEAKTAEGIRQISMNDPVFLGHFPGQPVLPGVLQVTAMEQTAKALFLAEYAGNGPAVLCAARKIKFRVPVTPGMTMRIVCTQNGDPIDGKVEYEIKNFVGEEIVSSGFVTLGIKDISWFEPEEAEETSDILSEIPAESVVMSTRDIMDIIPHRFPFMFVDGAYGLGDISEIVGFRNISGNDPFVRGSIPASFAGPLQVEAGAQLGCAALLAQPENKGKLGFFMSIDNAEFFRPVLPGDKLIMKMTCEPHGRFGIASGKFYVGNVLAATATLKFAVVDRT